MTSPYHISSLETTPAPYLEEVDDDVPPKTTSLNYKEHRYGFDPLVDNHDFTSLLPYLNDMVKKDLQHAGMIYAGSARSMGNEALYSILQSKGINISSAQLTVFYRLNVSGDVANSENFRLLRNELTTLRMNLTFLDNANAYVWNEYGIIALINFSIFNTSISYYFSGAQAVVAALQTVLAENGNLQHPPAANRLILDSNGRIAHSLKSLPEHSSADVWAAFYPYFNFTPAQLWDEFAASRANTILIYGSPGLGKSNFIRSMMDRRGYNDLPFLVDDENILQHSSLITMLNNLNYGSLLVAEDSDNLVRKRDDANAQMTGLLNVGEGISSGGLKMIISTNLNNLNEVDEALYRPGRTFRKLKFELLTHTQANTAREAIGLPPVTFKTRDNVSLALALNFESTLEDQVSTVIGFGLQAG